MEKTALTFKSAKKIGIAKMKRLCYNTLGFKGAPRAKKIMKNHKNPLTKGEGSGIISQYEVEAARFSPDDSVVAVTWQSSIVKERVVSSALFDLFSRGGP